MYNFLETGPNTAEGLRSATNNIGNILIFNNRIKDLVFFLILLKPDFMKNIMLNIFVVVFFIGTASGQIQQGPSKKLDSVSLKVISFLKSKQPDSVYALTGKAFREKITSENFNSITTNQIFPLTDFQNVKYVSTSQGINKYRIEGSPVLQLLIGLDVDDKIQTLLIQEYTGD